MCASHTANVSHYAMFYPRVHAPPGTVELGGMADTEADVAAASCEAILAFLWENGCIAQGGGVDGSDFLAAPAATCDATPLAAVHEVMPPHAGDSSLRSARSDCVPPSLCRHTF